MKVLQAKRGRGKATPGSSRGGVRSVTRRPAQGAEHLGPEIEERGLFGAVKSGKNMDVSDYQMSDSGELTGDD